MLVHRECHLFFSLNLTHFGRADSCGWPWRGPAQCTGLLRWTWCWALTRKRPASCRLALPVSWCAFKPKLLPAGCSAGVLVSKRKKALDCHAPSLSTFFLAFFFSSSGKQQELLRRVEVMAQERAKLGAESEEDDAHLVAAGGDIERSLPRPRPVVRPAPTNATAGTGNTENSNGDASCVVS